MFAFSHLFILQNKYLSMFCLEFLLYISPLYELFFHCAVVISVISKGCSESVVGFVTGSQCKFVVRRPSRSLAYTQKIPLQSYYPQRMVTYFPWKFLPTEVTRWIQEVFMFLVFVLKVCIR